MSKNKSSLFASSAVLAVLIGAVVCFLLYFFSAWFFKAKQNQTLVKSSELGNSSKGDLVFPVGSTMPDLSFIELKNGITYSLSSDESSIKIVNFWASWCEPCVEEFSSFANLIKEFNGRVSFVGINEDKSVDEAKEFLQAFKNDFKGLEKVYFGFDENQVFSKKYGILALPESFIVNGKGKLIRRVSGYENWDSEGAKEYFRSLLNKDMK